ncbi:50S ribosomal protein L23 [bacterium]|nr:50S ribosomal protein L23 [bacterium]
MKSSYSIIKRPIITEKNTRMIEDNKYVFEVAMDSNKIEIKKAIEDIFKVHVKKVNVSKTKRKEKRVRHNLGMTSEKKKAIVTLKEGEKIELAQ